jgi:hypothetical protein
MQTEVTQNYQKFWFHLIEFSSDLFPLFLRRRLDVEVLLQLVSSVDHEALQSIQSHSPKHKKIKL